MTAASIHLYAAMLFLVFIFPLVLGAAIQEWKGDRAGTKFLSALAVVILSVSIYFILELIVLQR